MSSCLSLRNKLINRRYDSFGNRTYQSQQTTACPASSSAVSTWQYADGSNRVTGVNAPGATTASPSPYTYDAAGNITMDTAAGNQYVYDGEGRVCASFSTDSTGYPIYTGYVYDAEGNRVAKGSIHLVTVNGTPTLSCDIAQNGLATAGDETDYILGPGGEQVTEVAQQSDGTMLAQRIYVYAGGSLIATYDTPSETTAPLPLAPLTPPAPLAPLLSRSLPLCQSPQIAPLATTRQYRIDFLLPYALALSLPAFPNFAG